MDSLIYLSIDQVQIEGVDNNLQHITPNVVVQGRKKIKGSFSFVGHFNCNGVDFTVNQEYVPFEIDGGLMNTNIISEEEIKKSIIEYFIKDWK